LVWALCLAVIAFLFLLFSLTGEESHILVYMTSEHIVYTL
jgi:hypothetical protein